MFLIRLLMGPIALLISYSTAQFLKPPEIVLQASSLGSFRAFIPNTCGIENFNFQWRHDPREEWRGGLIPGPINDFWTFEDPLAGLGIGDTLFYRAMIRLDGKGFRKPETPWLVTEVFDGFPPYPPPPPPPQGGCKKNQSPDKGIEDLGPSPNSTSSTTPSTTTSLTTTTPSTTTTVASNATENPATTNKASNATENPATTNKASNATENPATTDKTSEAPNETTTKVEETTENPKDMIERLDTNGDSEAKQETKKKPNESSKQTMQSSTNVPAQTTTSKPDQTDTNQIPGVIPKGVCERPWLLEPSPFDSTAAALEKHSMRTQCEMADYSHRYMAVIEALSDELTELKKLNYAMVTRMQRLETLLRSVPQPVLWA